MTEFLAETLQPNARRGEVTLDGIFFKQNKCTMRRLGWFSVTVKQRLLSHCTISLCGGQGETPKTIVYPFSHPSNLSQLRSHKIGIPVKG